MRQLFAVEAGGVLNSIFLIQRIGALAPRSLVTVAHNFGSGLIVKLSFMETNNREVVKPTSIDNVKKAWHSTRLTVKRSLIPPSRLGGIERTICMLGQFVTVTTMLRKDGDADTR
jgi:hypothetical protein